MTERMAPGPTVHLVVSLDGPAMADTAASGSFPARQAFKRVKATIPDEVRCLIILSSCFTRIPRETRSGEVGQNAPATCRATGLQNAGGFL